MSGFGYAGNILEADLTNSRISSYPSAEYTDIYMGGRGLGAKLYWDRVSPKTRAIDPDNCLICTNGPVTGFPGLAGSRCAICGKTRIRGEDLFCYGNLGGKWGVFLKYAGYDGLVVTGKAEKPVYLFIDNESRCNISSFLFKLSLTDSLAAGGTVLSPLTSFCFSPAGTTFTFFEVSFTVACSLAF